MEINLEFLMKTFQKNYINIQIQQSLDMLSGVENYKVKMYFCMVIEVEKLICRCLVMKMENLFKI